MDRLTQQTRQAVDLLEEFPVRASEKYRVASYFHHPETREMIYKSFGSRATIEEARALSDKAAQIEPTVPIFIFDEGKWALLLDPKDLATADLEGELEPRMKEMLQKRKENKEQLDTEFGRETEERQAWAKYMTSDEGLADPSVWDFKLNETREKRDKMLGQISDWDQMLTLFQAKKDDCLGIAPPQAALAAAPAVQEAE